MAQIKCMLEQVRQSLRPTNRTFHGAPGGGPPFKQAIGAEAYSLESPCFVESNIAPVPHLNFYIPSFMKRLSFIHTGSDEAIKCGCRLNLPQALLAGLDSLFLKKVRLPIENLARFGLNTTTGNIVRLPHATLTVSNRR